MFLRVLSLLAFAAAVSAVPLAEYDGSLHRESRAVKDQSVSFGNINTYDRVLASKTIYVPSSFLSVHEEKLDISVAGSTITFVKVDDLLKNGKNGEVKVKSGGPGQNTVSLKFKSKRGEKINYVVTVYGR